MLLALYIELNTNKIEKVSIDNVQDRLNILRGQACGYRCEGIKTSIFREITKRMQAFGLITMEILTQRIQDDVHLQTAIYEDEIVNAFKKVDYVR
jgi:hypothetical protein